MTDTQSTRQAHIEVTPEQGARFFSAPDENGHLVMLNLLKFRGRADYSHAPHCKSQDPISGADAFRIYMEGIEPLLVRSGGKLLFAGKADRFLIGPADEQWDFAMLVQQKDKASFLRFASDPQAVEITHHRTAAVADSRLLPLWSEKTAL